MADVTTSQAYDGARNYQIKLTNESDGTGQSGVKVVDVTTMTPNPGAHIKLRHVRYSITGMTVRLIWGGTPNKDLVILTPGTDELDFSKNYAGGWPDNATAGTGDILLTTIGAINGSSYTLELEFIKGV